MNEKIYSSNPAVNIIKSIGASPKFLVLTILKTLTVVFSILAISRMDDMIFDISYGFSSAFGSYMPFYDLYEKTSLLTMINAIYSLIPVILIVIGFWMFHAASKNVQDGTVKTTGLTMIRVVTMIRFILLCVSLASLLFLIPLMMFIPTVGSNYIDTGAYVVAMVVLLIIFAAFGVLVICYFAGLLKALKRIKATAMSGQPDNRISGYVIAMQWVFGILSALVGLASLFTSVFTGLSMLVSAATLIITALLLSDYKKRMTILTYPPTQGTPYQQAPVQQPYVNYQPQAQAQQPYGYAQPQAQQTPTPVAQQPVAQTPQPTQPIQAPQVPVESQQEPFSQHIHDAVEEIKHNEETTAVKNEAETIAPAPEAIPAAPTTLPSAENAPESVQATEQTSEESSSEKSE